MDTPTQARTVLDTHSPIVLDSNLTKKELAIEKSGARRELAYGKLVEMTSAKNVILDKFGGEHEVPDNPTQLRAAELILKVNNDLKEGGILVENKTINVAVSPEALKDMLHMVKDVADQLRGLRSNGRQTGEIIDVSIT